MKKIITLGMLSIDAMSEEIQARLSGEALDGPRFH
jgi:hypothetical protein